MLGGKLFHCHLASKWYTFRVSFTELEHKLKKYKKIKQGMMQELLTGRIRLV
jgi:type I restriction enzyme S subunit